MFIANIVEEMNLALWEEERRRNTVYGRIPPPLRGRVLVQFD
jgi:hypothetical protein